jgi:hypothetical protein
LPIFRTIETIAVMGLTKVERVQRDAGSTDRVTVTMDFTGWPEGTEVHAWVFVTQEGGAVASGSAKLTLDSARTPQITAELVEPATRRFSPEEPLTVVAYATEIWNAVLTRGRSPDVVEPGAPTVWQAEWQT